MPRIGSITLCALLSAPIASAQVTSDPVFYAVQDIALVHGRSGQVFQKVGFPATRYNLDLTYTSSLTFSISGTTMYCNRAGGFPKLYLYDTCVNNGTNGLQEDIYTTDDLSTPTASAAARAVMMDLADVPGRQAVIRVHCSVSLQGANSTARGRVDIDNDGVWEYTRSTVGFDTLEFPITMPASGRMTVKVETMASNSTNIGGRVYGSVVCWAEYDYPPRTRVVFQGYGNPCGGTLTGSAVSTLFSHQLTLALNNAPALVPGMLLIGLNRVDLPLPSSAACRLYTAPLASVPFFTDFAGSVSRQLPPVSTFQPARLYVQDLILVNPNQLGGSNGLDVDLKF